MAKFFYYYIGKNRIIAGVLVFHALFLGSFCCAYLLLHVSELAELSPARILLGQLSFLDCL